MTEATAKRTRKTRADALIPTDPLDAFAQSGVEEALKLLFWKARFQNPEFSVTVTPEDIKAFRDCIDYLEVKPQIRIVRPQGVPAQPMIPAHGNRRATPGREAIPPRNYVVVQMVDQDGNAFVPIENNQADFERQEQAKRARRIKETAGELAAQLSRDLASATISNATIEETIVALKTLCST